MHVTALGARKRGRGGGTRVAGGLLMGLEGLGMVGVGGPGRLCVGQNGRLVRI